jgi:hypothetical protein
MAVNRRTARRGNTVPFQERVGPWRRVSTTGKDPYDDSSDTLHDAYNGYIPDPRNGSGFFYRPGFVLSNGGTQLAATANMRGQGVINHIAQDGTAYNFIVFGGKVYRADAQFVLFVDVTPVGVTISSTATAKVYGTSFGSQLVITDGVNKPWIASNLGSTPITGTYIQFNAGNQAWATFGPPRIYGGSMFFILSHVNSTYARTDIVWSAPGDASVGYQQATYDFRWSLIQTSTDPLYALAATNTQLYYFREHSIGSISGAVGPSLQANATHDALPEGLGTVFPQCVVQFGQVVYFVDQMGRPWRLESLQPTPIYLQMRGIIEESPIGYPTVNALVASAAYEPYLNLYLVAPFSTNTFLQSPPVQAYAFDVPTAAYDGRWQIAASDASDEDPDLSIQIDCMGNFADPSGRQVLVVVGSLLSQDETSPAASGYVWQLNSNVSQGIAITTEALLVITTEATPALGLATEGTTANWADGENPPYRAIQTSRIGYAEDRILRVDRVTALVGSEDVLTISADSSAVRQEIECVPTPNPSFDGVNRAVGGFDGMMGRGVSVTVSPRTAFDQASIQSVAIQGSLANAAPDDA